MLSMKRCPHTGVVNFFDAQDPHFAVGSVTKAEGRTFYYWRCYAGSGDGAGRATDLKTAERNLAEFYGDVSGQDTGIHVRAA